jgi:hypothetical protein
MTDEQQQTEAPAKRPPGRPRGSTKKRNAIREPVHRGRPDPRRSEAPPLKTITYTPFEPKSSTDIPTDLVETIWTDYGGHLQWCVYEAGGKPTPEWISARQKNGFVDCRRGDFDGLLDFLAGPDGRMVSGGLVLLCRPREYQEQGQVYERRKATLAVEQMKESHAERGLDGVSMPGGNDAVARKRNTHRSSFELGPRIPD